MGFFSPFVAIFHFLGGITFALFLIGITACVVALGTFIEGQTGSHEAAAIWTYHHPLFLALLACFFINILFSSLRRWPFQKRHFPFLITHLGLLMLLTGVFLKNIFGLQGHLSLWEGSESQSVSLPHTYALKIERKSDQKESQIALASFSPDPHVSQDFPEMSFKIVGYAPDVKKEYALEVIKEPPPKITLQTFLTVKLTPKTASEKIEERIPGLVVEIQRGLEREKVGLAYDATHSDLKGSFLGGDYLIAFRPQELLIPHRLHLKEAREYHYPDSTQAYSYECDLLISKEKGEAKEVTLSMNHVFETEDGYRFYLSGMATSNDSSFKRVELTVNRDPFKYSMTYPGGFFVSLGAFLLFWRNRKRNP